MFTILPAAFSRTRHSALHVVVMNPNTFALRVIGDSNSFKKVTPSPVGKGSRD